jgi:hypothetical protein
MEANRRSTLLRGFSVLIASGLKNHLWPKIKRKKSRLPNSSVRLRARMQRA